MTLSHRTEPTVAEAQRDAALDALEDLMRMVARDGGYKSHEDLEAIWRAHAVLVENEREWR